ncbi:hypothetical protein, partial [Klebsiella pneumoniae]|uniref:hypothetical protein n=1 Tax=Klebsiella pneumoniae TaxID=573 RepID=UPI00385502DA
GTINATTIPENGTSLPGIQVLTSNSFDAFGGFSTIPVINGYDYGYSIMLGSTSISSSNGGKGGYIRGISYSIQVPNGFGPYTMTYAYA